MPDWYSVPTEPGWYLQTHPEFTKGLRFAMPFFISDINIKQIKADNNTSWAYYGPIPERK